ncbi:MAG: hypothetical protein ACMUJM_20865 [bacterium]
MEYRKKAAREHIERVRTALKDRVKTLSALSQWDIWGEGDSLLWKSGNFIDKPWFYPVYHFRDTYSFSPLSLILLKGKVILNPKAVNITRKRNFFYLPLPGSIDREISRLGAPMISSNSLFSETEYANHLASAIRSDVKRIEKQHRGTTNIVLCGGKDSLNLLLLPWENSVMAASAPPNYELVCQFVSENQLKIDVIKLCDTKDEDVLGAEIAENCSRMNLEHCRWGADLQRLCQETHGKVLFWKGQVADALTTPKWESLCHPVDGLWHQFLRSYNLIKRVLPDRIRELVARRIIEPRFRITLWQRCAMWQGSHMSLIRAITGSHVFSAYHGPETTRVFGEVDLTRAVLSDMRILVGKILAGSDVWYPSLNPAPPPSKFREGLARADLFLDILKNAGVKIISG